MRRLVLFIVLLFATPAMAQFWSTYRNDRFAYEVDVPPDFVGNGENNERDGQLFFNSFDQQRFAVWGGSLIGTFEDEALAASDALSGLGWTITERSSTSEWAQLTAVRDQRQTVERMILLCDGASYATVSMEFLTRDIGRVTPLLDGVTRSFRRMGC